LAQVILRGPPPKVIVLRAVLLFVPPGTPTFTVAEARLEAAARSMRLKTVVQPLWKASRSWTAAIVLALFPFLFLVDGVVDLPVSPVLPGLALLFLLIVGLPFALVELASRRYRRKGADWQEAHALKAVNVSRGALSLAAVWLLLWFAVGT
jgi:hypothetical protein